MFTFDIRPVELGKAIFTFPRRNPPAPSIFDQPGPNQRRERHLFVHPGLLTPDPIQAGLEQCHLVVGQREPCHGPSSAPSSRA